MDTAVNHDLFLKKLNVIIAGKRDDNFFLFFSKQLL